jgi:hypothetical protein
MSLVSFVRWAACCSLALICLTNPLKAQLPGPGPEHEKLKEFVGKWTFTVKTPDGNESKGTSEYKLECGGLWLISDFKTDFGGGPFQGKGIDGFDPAKKKYVSVWVDSMTTAPMSFEGEYDKEGTTLTMISNSLGPDGKPAVWRSTSKLISKNEHRFEMFLKPAGSNEQSMMVVNYRRAE